MVRPTAAPAPTNCKEENDPCVWLLAAGLNFDSKVLKRVWTYKNNHNNCCNDYTQNETCSRFSGHRLETSYAHFAWQSLPSMPCSYVLTCWSLLATFHQNKNNEKHVNNKRVLYVWYLLIRKCSMHIKVASVCADSVGRGGKSSLSNRKAWNSYRNLANLSGRKASIACIG